MIEKKKAFTYRVPRKYIGQYRPRSDGYEKASGLAKFTDDITLKRLFPDMLYMKILKSPYPHARIKRIDTSRAEALPGVKAILKYTDPEIMELKMTSACWSDATGSQDQKRGWTHGVLDRKVLGDTAHWAGDELGVAIGAEDPETVEEAIRLVDVEWEVLPFVLTVEDALKPEAPLIHPEVNPDNNCIPNFDFTGPDIFLDHGDVDKAFAEADVIVETACTHGNAQQCALDYWSCCVEWNRNDQITVWSNSYAVDQTRIHFYDMFSKYNLPMSNIRVISPFVGGSHGRGDTGDQPFFLLCGLMSRKTGRPVKYRQSRKEHFHDTRTAGLGKVKIGAKRDGTITALQSEFDGNMGAYADIGIAAVKFVPGEWAEACIGHIPNIRMIGRGVYTNTIPSSCVRSIGNIHMNNFVGLALDTLAEKLDMDPIELAIKNLGHHVVPIPNPCVEEVVRAGARQIGWERRHAPGKGEWFEGTKKRGIGFSVNNTWHTENQEIRRGPIQVLIKLNPDGTVILDAPTVETGPGSNSCAIAACAETLGVRFEDVRWISVQDTETGLKDQVQTDSAVSYILAESVTLCALDVKRRLLEMVGGKLNREPEELDVNDGRVFVKASPDTGITIKEYYESIDLTDGGNLVPLTGYINKPIATKDVGIAYMACFAEVEVDTETGQVDVLKLVVPSDGGTVINPSGAEGQLVGGQCQGMGESLFEGMIYDEATGIPLNFNFVDYKFPTMADFPDIDPLCMEVYQGNGLFGACGMGEAAPCCTPRAIENAIYNAVGVRMKEFPITPDKVLEALGKVGE